MQTTLISRAGGEGLYKSADMYVAELMEDLGLTKDEDYKDKEAMIIRWLFRCNQKIKAFPTFRVLEFEYTVENCLIPKPLDMIRLLEMSIPLENGSCIYPYFVANKTSYASYLSPNLRKNNFFKDFTVTDDMNSFQCSSPMEGRTVKIMYEGFLLDERGMPYIDMRLSETYKAWVSLKMAEQSRNKADIDFYDRQFRIRFGEERAQIHKDGLNKVQLDQLMAMMDNPYALNQNNPFYRVMNNQNLAFHNGLTSPIYFGREYYGTYIQTVF